MLDQVMHVHINFRRLALIQGTSYIKFSEWITKKAVMNQNHEFYLKLENLHSSAKNLQSSLYQYCATAPRRD